ncbi:hypothetical protein ZIOFF_067647 [Zingiber officinale]|uniref:TRF2/HOY1 PH-like domain-containing protein n=1 Tax=Zingiber officinale TaxID=94328 RepID=A0A8J5CB87_ZINOF|nr:hypothetical protein ZIOFF_067647 [Zingiber officinale]
MMLSQAKAGKTLCFTSSKGSEVGEQSDFSASLSSLSKIKASNFPASLLRIGTWECVSRYEGDLVEKCYFTKRKLVWEVLEGGLKSKIEFHWSDITAIKAVFFEGDHGTLDIVYSVLEDQNDSKSHINDVIKDDSRTTLSDFYEPGLPCAISSISNKMETQDSFRRTPDFDSQDTPSPCSIEELSLGNTSLPCDALFDKEIGDFITQFFGNDSQSSVEQSIIGSDDEPYSTLEAEALRASTFY